MLTRKTDNRTPQTRLETWDRASGQQPDFVLRKALLLYNPLSGGRTERRRADVEAVLDVLHESGLTVTASVTGSAERATAQAREAAQSGMDAVFACGGDGTIHDVLQGLVGTQCALGIIPLGTANTLAHDLRIPRNPVAAARAALSSRPRRLAVGKIDYHDLGGNPASRFFTVAVGIGVDAHLFYRLNQEFKTRLGMTAYYAKATQLWLSHKMEFFQAEYVESNTRLSRQARVSELLAVRIRHFGGVLRELAPGASLSRSDVRLVLFHTRNRFRFLQHIVRGWLGQSWNVKGIELRSAERVACTYLPGTDAELRIFVEADGELVGTLPVGITMVPDALTLLVPPAAK